MADMENEVVLTEEDVSWEDMPEGSYDAVGEVTVREYNNTVLQNRYDVPNGNIIGTIPAGIVEVLQEDEDWAEVAGGWIQKQYFAE